MRVAGTARRRSSPPVCCVGYGAAFVYGLIAIGTTWDFLSINAADNVLHLLTAIVSLVIALGPVRTAVPGRVSRV